MYVLSITLPDPVGCMFSHNIIHMLQSCCNQFLFEFIWMPCAALRVGGVRGRGLGYWTPSKTQIYIAKLLKICFGPPPPRPVKLIYPSPSIENKNLDPRVIIHLQTHLYLTTFLFLTVRISLCIWEFIIKTVVWRVANIFKNNCIIYEAPIGFRILHFFN